MDVIEAIKEQIDLVGFIGERVDLRRSGQVYQGLCPMHRDHQTPSLTVWPDRWHCFGCGRGGTIIDFQMEYEHQEFVQAVKTLAAIFGIKGDLEHISIDPWIKAMKAIKKPIFKNNNFNPISEEAIKEYQKYRHPNLKKEGWEERTIELFQIGYCLDIYDFDLYDRIVFPIRDENGKPIGFSGRKPNDNDERKKYRLLPGIDKGDLLYNLHLALPEIKRTKQLIVTEGMHEVMRSWEAGIRNMVSIFGAKPSEGQLRTIMRHSRDIIIALDNDDAGRDGVKKFIEGLGLFCKLRVVEVPKPYKDLGEVRDYNLIRQLIETAKEIS